MKFRTYILIGLLAFFGAGLLLTSDVQAMTCKMEGGLSGECRNDCNADELSHKQLMVLNSDTYSLVGGKGCVGAEVCCVAKGSSLCSDATASAPSVPGNFVGNFSCVANCAAEPASKYINLEVCSGGNVCCAEPAKEQPKAKGTTTPVKTITLCNPLCGSACTCSVTLYTVIQRVIKAFLGIVGALALLVFIYSGVLWMTAEASDRIQKAKDTMKYAVIGLAMIAFAYAISTFAIDVLTGKYAKQSQPQDVEYAQQNEFENN